MLVYAEGPSVSTCTPPCPHKACAPHNLQGKAQPSWGPQADHHGSWALHSPPPQGCNGPKRHRAGGEEGGLPAPWGGSAPPAQLKAQVMLRGKTPWSKWPLCCQWGWAQAKAGQIQGKT